MKLLVKDGNDGTIYGILYVAGFKQSDGTIKGIPTEAVQDFLDGVRAFYDEHDVAWSIDDLVEQMNGLGVMCTFEDIDSTGDTIYV